MEYMNYTTTNRSQRNGTQIPRRTESTRSENKSQSLDRDLDFIKDTSCLLRDIRIELQYTQTDIAKKTGIKQQMISRIDRNDLNPRLSTLKKYLLACGIDLDELLRAELYKIKQSGY